MKMGMHFVSHKYRAPVRRIARPARGTFAIAASIAPMSVTWRSPSSATAAAALRRAP